MSRHRTRSWRHDALLAGSHGKMTYFTRVCPLVVLLSRLVEYSPSIGHKLHKDQNMTIRPILGEYSTSLDSNTTNGSIIVEYTLRQCDPASEAPCRQELVPFRGESSSTLGCLQRRTCKPRTRCDDQPGPNPSFEAFHIDTACARLGPCGWRCVGRPMRTIPTLCRSMHPFVMVR